MRGAPGPLLPEPLNARAAGSAQRPRPARSTPTTSPGSGLWVAPWGRGSACLGLNPHPRLLLLHLEPLPALEARLFHSLVAAPSPSSGKRSLPQSRLTVHWLVRTPNPCALLASELPGDPCPASLGHRLPLHHQHLSPLSPTWHSPQPPPMAQFPLMRPNSLTSFLLWRN